MKTPGRVVVAGGSGLIGRALVESLLEAGVEAVVLTRRADADWAAPGVRVAEWDGRTVGAWKEAIDGAAAVVNLCGENVGAGRWSAARKVKLRSSRLEPTRALVEAIRAARARPKVLVQASAVGFYGASDDRELDESAPAGSGFLPDLCVAWEAASAEVEALGVRRVLLRSGIVMARHGGALAKMLPAFRLGVAGRLGDGRQWFSWIHLEDHVEAIQLLLERDDLSGAFNLTAPQPVRNEELTRTLARTLRRPALLPVPRFVLRALFGEMGDVLLQGQRAVPRRLLAAGHRFRYPELDGALAALLRRPVSRKPR
jgi:uncharacterized protein (TIGR01777 family)